MFIHSKDAPYLLLLFNKVFSLGFFPGKLVRGTGYTVTQERQYQRRKQLQGYYTSKHFG